MLVGLRPSLIRQPVSKGRTPGVGDQQQQVEGGSDFPNRDGYEPGFLGRSLPLPGMSSALQQDVAPLLSDPSRGELKYTHFSVVMSKMRRLPILTAVNIDGAQLKSVPRNDRWVTDNRIAREHQLGNEAYKSNDIDRGHMVRRLDPVWGEEAVQANADTFVYTNSALQHKDLNRREWVALEEHILSHARTTDQKMTVLTGPVFRSDDPEFDNGGRVVPSTQIPQQFWKVAIWNNPSEGLQGTAFVLSQEELIDRADYRDGKFDPGRFQIYQVPLEQLEGMTQLDFGEVEDTVERGGKIDTVQDVNLGSAALDEPITLPDREVVNVG